MRHVRRGTVLGGLVVSVLALGACETTRNPIGTQQDNVPPVISLTNTAGDTQDISGGLRFSVLIAPRGSVTDPTTPPIDSIVYTAPLADSVEFFDTLTVVPTSGTFDVVGFAEDSAGRRGFSSVVTVTIQSAANDVTKPLVS